MDVRQAKAGDEVAIERVAERSWESGYPRILDREHIEEEDHRRRHGHGERLSTTRLTLQDSIFRRVVQFG